jgi:hypothetical protein
VNAPWRIRVAAVDPLMDRGGIPTERRTLSLEIYGCVFAAILLNLVGDLLAFIETVQARALDSADMDENVLPAAVGLNEAETFGGVEPLDRACSHYLYPNK